MARGKEEEMLDVKDSALSRLVCGTVICREPHDLALGWLRYEALRKLNVEQFRDTFVYAMDNDIPFDTLVDGLVLKEFG